MVMIRGQDIILSVETSGEGIVPIAGLRSRKISCRAQAVESDSIEHVVWRGLVAEAGLRRVVISGSGHFVDDEAATLARRAFISGAHEIWDIRFTDLRSLRGRFQVVLLEMSGIVDGEATMSIELVSAGDIVEIGT